jgi:cyclopropane fatty-acyl-phospholipid synthase-like methyltransferase
LLDKAKLQPGGTLLDVGAGDGLIAFGALERLGSGGGRMRSAVAFLAAAEELAAERSPQGVDDQAGRHSRRSSSPGR